MNEIPSKLEMLAEEPRKILGLSRKQILCAASILEVPCKKLETSSRKD